MAVTWCSPGSVGPAEPPSAGGGVDIGTMVRRRPFRSQPGAGKVYSDGIQTPGERQVDGGYVARPAAVGGVVDVHAPQRRAAVEGAIRIEVVPADEARLVVDAD